MRRKSFYLKVRERVNMFDWFDWVTKILFNKKKNKDQEMAGKVGATLDEIASLQCFICLDKFDYAFKLARSIKSDELKYEVVAYIAKKRMEFYKKRIPFFIKAAKDIRLDSGIFNVNPKYIDSVCEISRRLGKNLEYFGTSQEEIDSLHLKVIRNQVIISKRIKEAKSAGLPGKSKQVYVEGG